MVTRIFLVGLAGGLGTLTRYVVGLWAARTLGASFPYGTLFVNLGGCFLIAFIAHAAAVQVISPAVRLTLTTGFMGGLTTYSSFNLETTQLLRDRAWGVAGMNLAATLFGCFVAGLLGLALARAVFGD
jgi:CrcB protein